MFERGKKDVAKPKADDSAQKGFQQSQGAVRSEPSRTVPETSRKDVAVIGRSIRINGDLQGDEDLRIEGDVTGTVELKNNTLTIGNEGKIRADVYAKSVTVDGLVEGDLFGSEQVNIRRNAQVRGNITAPRVSLEDGARFKGSIEMDPEAVDSALGRGHGHTAGTGSKDASATITPVTAARTNGERPAAKATAPKDATKSESLR